MAWDFSTEPEFEKKLEWIRWFRAERVDPLDLVYPDRAFHPLDEETGPIVRALKQQVRDQGLWAPHLGPELGGRGFGQLKLALINEILGESSWAPVIFGTAAPDTGNAEIIARYGTEEQKERYLKPLLEGECFSCFSMTEPQAAPTRRCSPHVPYGTMGAPPARAEPRAGETGSSRAASSSPPTRGPPSSSS